MIVKNNDIARYGYVDRRQSVRIRDKQSSSCRVLHGVPQGSILGPFLFIMYIADVAMIPEKHGLLSHFYADDVQLYLSCHRGQTAVCASRVSACIDDITTWMASNRLMVNPAKFLFCGVRQANHHLIHHYHQPALLYNRQLVSVILMCCSTLTCLSLPTSISLPLAVTAL